MIEIDTSALQQEKEIVNPLILNRDSLIIKLKAKIDNKQPIVIHTFVALYGYNFEKCIGEPDWADGTNRQRNLYWGAGYGLKTYFKKYDGWKLIYERDSISEFVLERDVFFKTFSNNAKVYLIADAYIGHEMKTCLTDYLSAISEKNIDSLDIEDKSIPANGNADLIVFNGHNGLLDYEINVENNKCNNLKETAIICCGSYFSFAPKLKNNRTFPLITTVGAIPAEGYILGSIIGPWVLLKPEQDIRQNVVDNYLKIQKCSQEEADFLFITGWE